MLLQVLCLNRSALPGSAIAHVRNGTLWRYLSHSAIVRWVPEFCISSDIAIWKRWPIWEDQRFGLAAENVSDPHVVVISAHGSPVNAANCIGERTARFFMAALLVERHRQNKVGTLAQGLRGIAGHQLDGLVVPTLAISRQPFGETIVGIVILVPRPSDCHGPLGERHGLRELLRRWRRQQKASASDPLGDVRVARLAELCEQVAADAAVLGFVSHIQAQLGVTEPVFRCARAGDELRFPVGKRRGATADLDQRAPHVAFPRGALFREQPRGFAEFRSGLVETTLAIQAHGQMVVRPTDVGIEAKRLPVIGDRLTQRNKCSGPGAAPWRYNAIWSVGQSTAALGEHE